MRTLCKVCASGASIIFRLAVSVATDGMPLKRLAKKLCCEGHGIPRRLATAETVWLDSFKSTPNIHRRVHLASTRQVRRKVW